MIDIPNLYFVADDYFYTGFKSLSDAIRIYPDLYHFSPVFWVFMRLIKTVFGQNPFAFHMIAAFFHLIATVFVYILVIKLFRSRINAFLTALLFLFFFSHYEVVFWITGIQTSLMTVFYILGLILYLNYSKTKNIYYLISFNFLFTLSLFTHEYAISLPLVILFYELINKRKKLKVKNLLFLIYPAFLILLLFLVKRFFTYSALVVATPSIGRIISSIIKSSVYLFFPFPQIIDVLPKTVLVIIFLILVSILIKVIRKDRMLLWLFLWVMTQVLIFSLTSLPQARYFYTASIPSLILIISLLDIPDKKFISFKLSYLILILVFGLNFLNVQKGLWVKSSYIIKESLLTVKNNYQEQDKEKYFYFINLPDSINGPPWNAYTFRSGWESALTLNGINIKDIKYARTIPYDEKIRDDEYINSDELESLKIRNKIFIFDWNKFKLYAAN